MLNRFATALLTAALFCTLAPAQEEPLRTMRIYDIGGLVPRASGQLRRVDEPLVEFVGPWTGMVRDEEQYIPKKPDTKQIISIVEDLIYSVVADVHIRASSSGEHLKVWATPAEHERVAHVLELLHAHSGEPFEVEVRYFSFGAERVDPKILALLEAAVQGGLNAENLKSLARLDRNLGLRRGTLHAPHGQWSSFHSLRTRKYVPDFDVEIAQGSCIADPVTYPLSEGVAASVRPFLLQDGRALLRILASAGQAEQPFRRFRVGTTDLGWINRTFSSGGELEQADFHGSVASTEAILSVGETAAVIAGSPTGWELLLFTLKQAPKPCEAGTMTLLPAGALTFEAKERELGFDVDEMTEVFHWYRREFPPRMSNSELHSMLKGPLEDQRGSMLVGTPWLQGTSFVVRADVATAGALQSLVRGIEQDFLRPVRLSIRLISSSGEGGSSKTIGMLDAPLVAGRGASFASYHRADYMGDYDVEVAQEARIADPVLKVAYAGLFAHARVSKSGTRSYRMRLGLRIAAFPEGIQEINHSTPDFGAIQTVPVLAQRTVVTLDFTKGARTVDMGGDPFHPEHRLFAIVNLR